MQIVASLVEREIEPKCERHREYSQIRRVARLLESSNWEYGYNVKDGISSECWAS